MRSMMPCVLKFIEYMGLPVFSFFGTMRVNPKWGDVTSSLARPSRPQRHGDQAPRVE
jgi:hypothetical protein